MRASVRGMGVAVITTHVDVVPLAGQLVALQDAEAVLLVDHGEPEAVEAKTLLDQGVGAHRDLRLAGSQPLDHRGALLPLEGRREERRLVGASREEAAEGQEVLLREDLGGRHEGGLVSVLEGDDHGEKGDHRLPRAHVALDQPVHGMRGSHVVGDLAEDALLRAGQVEGQDALHRLAHAGADVEGDPLPRAAQAATPESQTELEEEELLEDEADVAGARGTR